MCQKQEVEARNNDSRLDRLLRSTKPASIKLVELLAARAPERVLPPWIVAKATPETADEALQLVKQHPYTIIDAEVAEPLLAKDAERLKKLVKDSSCVKLVETLCTKNEAIAAAVASMNISGGPMILVQRGSVNQCIFTEVDKLKQGDTVRFTLKSHPGKGIGKKYRKERWDGPWRSIESAGCLETASIHVRYEDDNYIKLAEDDLVLAVSHWNGEGFLRMVGNTVNFVGGSTRLEKTKEDGVGRDWIINDDGTISAKHRPGLVLGMMGRGTEITPDPLVDRPWYIVNVAHQKYLDTHGREVSLWGDGTLDIGTASQNLLWELRSAGPEDIYYIVSVAHQRYLDTDGGTGGKDVWISRDAKSLDVGDSPSNLQWRLKAVDGIPNTFYMINVGHSKFLDSHGSDVWVWGDGRDIGDNPSCIQWRLCMS